ncbi:conserved hypothetical protein [Gammaproteobacteria bacterium]
MEKSPKTPAVLTLVSFGVGTLRCAVEAHQVATLSLATPDTTRDHAGQLLELPGPYPATGRQLQMYHPAGCFVLDVDEPVILQTLPHDAIHPLPPLLAARNRLPFLRALALDATGLMLILDWTRLSWSPRG